MIKEITENSKLLEIPLEINGYVYQETIGYGAFSVVTLVKNIKNNELFGCKVISREEVSNRGFLLRLEQELRIQQSLSHENIVRIFDVIYQTDLICIIMEYCSNGDLFNYITSKKKILGSILRQFFFEIVSGLNYLHLKKISHRDLKPENILINSSNQIKLADFGFAKQLDQINYLSKTSCGSFYYASPEIIKGLNYDGMKSDIWSLGILLFVLSTNKIPWTAKNEIQLKNQIIESKYKLPESLSEDISQIIQICLNKDPNLRPTTLELLNSSFFNNIKENQIELSKSFHSPIKNKIEVPKFQKKFIVRPNSKKFSNTIPIIKDPHLKITPKCVCFK